MKTSLFKTSRTLHAAMLLSSIVMEMVQSLKETGYIQSSPIFGQKDTNFKEVEEFLRSVKANSVMLSEFFAAG
jgi:hypothetical protein